MERKWTSFALQLDSVHDFRLTLHNRSIVVKGRVVHRGFTRLPAESSNTDREFSSSTRLNGRPG